MKESVTSILLILMLAASLTGLPLNTLSTEFPAEYHLAPPLDEEPPTPNLSTTLVSTAGEEESLGPITVVVILIEFKNLNHTVSREDMENRFFKDVSGYYREASNGRAWIVGDVAGWYRLEQTKSYYGRDGRMVDDPNFDGAIDSWWLIRDAVEVADPDVDFAEYDNVVVVHAGYGQETSRVSDDIWSVAYWGGLWIRTEDTRSVYGGAIVPEMEDRGADPFGVCCHELAHLIGLPDLYGHGGEKNWVDKWGLMDRGLWNGDTPGSSPAHPVAWSRIMLGWISNNEVVYVNASMKMNLTLTYLTVESDEHLAVKIPIDRYRYYLVEARGRTGYDEALPDEGVLVYSINEKLTYGGGRVEVIDANPETETLNDAAYHQGDSYIDVEKSIRIQVHSRESDKYTLSVDRSGPAPDIAIKNVYFEPTIVKENDTVTMYAQVANEGVKEANNFKVNLYINGQLFETIKLSLKPGATETIKSDWVAESGLNIVKFALDRSTVEGDADPANDEFIAEFPVGYSIIIEVPYNLTVKVDGVEQNPGGDNRVEINVLEGDITIELEENLPLGEGIRASFTGWGDGDHSNPRKLEVNNDLILKALFQKEYRVQVDEKGGVVQGAGWYPDGAEATIKASSPSIITKEKHRLVFQSWSGDFKGTSPTFSVNVTEPISLEASWSSQFYLTIDSPFGPVSGSGWYDNQGMASFEIGEPTIEEEGTRMIFEGWKGDFIDSTPNGAIRMDGPKKLETVWRVEHELTVKSIYGEPQGSGWYLEGEMAQIKVNSIVEHGNNTRHIFKGWKGDVESLQPSTQVLVDQPKNVEAEWSTMYLVTLGVKGVPPNDKLNITVNGEDNIVEGSEPLAIWVENGETLTLNATKIVPAKYGYYTLDRWENGTGSPVDGNIFVDKPVTLNAVYKAGIGCIIATSTYGSELSPQVSFLRAFRDQRIMESNAGRSFLQAFNAWYYSYSPSTAIWINEHEWVKPIIRCSLIPLLSALTITAHIHQTFHTCPEAAAVMAGLAASSIIGLVYLSLPSSIIYLALQHKIRRMNERLKTLILTIALGLASSLAFITIGEITSNSVLLSASTACFALTALLAGAFAPIYFANWIKRRLHYD